MTPAARGLRLFFASSFAWNFGLGMTHILVPLYAHHLGFSGVAIGSLVSLPIIAQVGLNLLGGAWTDRVGGRRLALWSCAAVVIAGSLFANAHNFASLLAAQFALIIARAMFWPATWSLATLLPGDRSRTMGRLNSITSLGQIFGTGAAGFAIAHWGYPLAFWFLALTGGALAYLLMWVFHAPAPRHAASPQPMLTAYRQLLARRAIYYAVLCAYISALPFSLSISFYPILLVDQGFSSGAAGWMLALRGVGAVAAGFVAGGAIRRSADARVALGAGLMVALSVVLVAAFRDPLLISVFLFGVGLGSGVMTLYFQLLISDLSATAERGSALALGSLGWGISHLTTPLIMGALNDSVGTVPAFYFMGAIALASACLLKPAYRWAFIGATPR